MILLNNYFADDICANIMAEYNIKYSDDKISMGQIMDFFNNYYLEDEYDYEDIEQITENMEKYAIVTDDIDDASDDYFNDDMIYDNLYDV